MSAAATADPPCHGAPNPARRCLVRGLSFRPAGDDDLAFLERLYGTTRAEEMAMVVDWSDDRKAQFLSQQFNAQRHHYETHFPDSARLIIEGGGVAIGRLYLDRRAEEHRIIDIALLPEFRGQGLGAAVMQDVMDEAAATGKSVTIHVEHLNPALTLYRRLGFTQVEDQGVYHLMAWTPPSPRPSPRGGEGDR